MVLDSSLRSDPSELLRIFVHELFHFAWVRLGNLRRNEFAALLDAEFERGARGELGWSADWRKQALGPHDRAQRTRRWRDYVCESFCDSAACVLSNIEHAEFTLAPRFRTRRAAWFREAFGSGIRV